VGSTLNQLTAGIEELIGGPFEINPCMWAAIEITDDLRSHAQGNDFELRITMLELEPHTAIIWYGRDFVLIHWFHGANTLVSPGLMLAI